MTNDGYNAYVYDAEGRICAVNGPQGMVGYQYDADGNRVGKGMISTMSCDLTSNGYSPTTDYVLDQGGGQMTEVAVGGGAQTWVHTNVTANGTLIATYDTTGSGLHFHLTDWVGTYRVQTDPSGNPEMTCTSLPFGDSPLCIEATEQFFTGLERDPDTGLDRAMERQYSSTLGRWTTPDPYNGSIDLTNPQSLNRYAYVTNMPLNLTDPSGLDDDGGFGGFSFCFICIIEDIFGFGGSPVHLSHPPFSAGKRPWDEHGSYIPQSQTLTQMLNLPDPGCEFGACGDSFTDHNEAQTRSQFQEAYLLATAGRLLGLGNIYNHSGRNKPYDFSYEQPNDTWTLCGQTLKAGDFGNFIAGFQAGAYDNKYRYTTGGGTAFLITASAGVVFHVFGDTQAVNDPLDLTGLPRIYQGAVFGGRWNGSNTACSR